MHSGPRHITAGWWVVEISSMASSAENGARRVIVADGWAGLNIKLAVQLQRPLDSIEPKGPRKN